MVENISEEDTLEELQDNLKASKDILYFQPYNNNCSSRDTKHKLMQNVMMLALEGLSKV